jgi:hypothetical protein
LGPQQNSTKVRFPATSATAVAGEGLAWGQKSLVQPWLMLSSAFFHLGPLLKLFVKMSAAISSVGQWRIVKSFEE